MEFVDTTELTVKGERGEGSQITTFIRNTLKEIPEGKAIALSDLVEGVVQNTTVADKKTAYTRVNQVLKQKDFAGFQRFTRENSTFIGKPIENASN